MTLTHAPSLALLILGGVLAGLSGCNGNDVQAGSGSASEVSGPPTFNETYQARNPRICAKVTSPPSAAQASALVQCSTESDTTGSSTPLITLITDLQVEIGSPRNFMPGPDYWSNIDPGAKVYPIRGHGTMWQCSPVPQYPAGQNCVSYPAAGSIGQGTCFKTTFGDWTCKMPTGGPRQVLKQKGPTIY